MDHQQREQFRDIVVTAMHEKAWSAAKLAKEAGISQATTTRITRGEDVAALTVSKVRHALGIEPLAKAQADEGYSLIIEVVRDAIGMYLRDLPEDQLAPKIAHLFAAIAHGNDRVG